MFVTAAVLLLAGCDTERTRIVYGRDDVHDEDEERQFCPTFSGVNFDSIREIWQCFDTFDRNQGKVLVTLTRLEGVSDGFGEVSVGDTTHPATFRINGIDWRWDFGCDERDAARWMTNAELGRAQGLTAEYRNKYVVPFRN